MREKKEVEEMGVRLCCADLADNSPKSLKSLKALMLTLHRLKAVVAALWAVVGCIVVGG